MQASLESVMLGGGCFWCVEAAVAALAGVQSVEPGYAGGRRPSPTYEQVCTGVTGHAEVVRVVFDPQRLALAQLLEVFFAIHDPTTLNRQGHDVGTQYRSVVYCASAAQRAATVAWIAAWQARQHLPAPVVTEVIELTEFWPAETEHHHYYARNPQQGYCRMVIAPKVARVRQQFGGWLRDEG